MNLVRKIVLLQEANMDGRVAARSHKNSENRYKPAISTALSDGLVGFIVCNFIIMLKTHIELRMVILF